jgi:hypothetical protein
MKWLDKFPLYVFLVFALSLGLAPFFPEPHVWEKLKMLTSGQLKATIDIIDLFMHGTPWVLLLIKLAHCSYGKKPG